MFIQAMQMQIGKRVRLIVGVLGTYLIFEKVYIGFYSLKVELA